MGMKFVLDNTPEGSELHKMAKEAMLGFCPFCEKPVEDNFKNEISRKEFRISGMCQKCQDNFYGKD